MVLLKVFSVLVTILLGHRSLLFAQDSDITDVSCVQVSRSNFSTTCPCGLTSFSFSVVGETSMAERVVNLAVVLDGSDSVGSANYLVEQEFAKSITAAFAERNLFANGGTASYVKSSSSFIDQYASDTGTFFSLEDFNNFVDGNQFNGGITDIDDGITAARYLLNAAPPASAAFIVVVIAGIKITIGIAADEARADGITLYAVGVGVSVSVDVLLANAGSKDSILGVDDFADLEGFHHEVVIVVLLCRTMYSLPSLAVKITSSASTSSMMSKVIIVATVVDDILGEDGTSTVPCPATNVTLIVECGATVDSVVSDPDATVSNDIVTFFVSDLEDNPTNFAVMLDTCGATEPVDPVVSIKFIDDQGNSPDFTELLDVTSDSTCPPATSPPTPCPT